MAGFVEQIAGVEQALRVDNQATRLKRDSRQKSAGVELRQANGQADLPEPVDDAGCGGIKHRFEFNV
jgi:anti-sigma factor ChrR (cupin superfamily)